MTNKIMPLADAVARNVRDGQTVSMEGFTHLIPFAAGHEVIRQGRKDLRLVRMTPDIIYDQLIGMGCARGVVFSWGGNPGVGSIHRFRDAIENGWPHPLAIEEHSHADMAGRYQAGASGLPFSVLRGYVGSDLPKHNPNIKSITCPFTGEKLAATPAINPDVAIIHAQRADRKGNVLIEGIVGIQKEAVLAAKSAIVTVEEIVDDLNAPMNACFLPHWVLSAVCEVPNGAHPSYAHGYYGRDNAFCKAWDSISREREAFLEWMKKHVMGTKTHEEFMKSAGITPARHEVAYG
jgi:glutaconate CoA-transferase subunit A